MTKASDIPVFIYGALRSGTTLLRLMLKFHSRMFTTGEADFLFDYITADPDSPGGWRYDLDRLAGDRIFRAKDITLPDGLQGLDLAQSMIDQMAAKSPGQRLCLSIHRNAHLMRDLFPEVPVVHLLRDPRDVARSAVGMGWSGNSYFAVEFWIKTETTWNAAAYPADQVHEVQFETLMADLEGQLTRICGFLGLEFETGMLDYHTQSTYGPPDPNVAQKWREKATPREIALLEGRAGHLMVPLGYELSDTPATPGLIEKAMLTIDHRTRRWLHNIQRYGFWLFATHHAANRLGLKTLASKTFAKQEAIRIKELK